MTTDDSLADEREARRQQEIARSALSLQARDSRVREAAARRLGDLRAPPAPLLTALHDQNSFVRAAAAHALGLSDVSDTELRSEVIEQLLAAIDDQNDFVCEAALGSLGLLDAQDAREQVLECLNDESERVVRGAVTALGRLGAPADAERIAAFLDHPQPGMRLAAVRAVGLLNYAAAAPSLLAGLTADRRLDLPRRVRLPLLTAYVEALSRLQAREAIPVLVELAQNEIGVRTAAVETLVRWQAAEVAPLLIALLGDPSWRLRRALLRLLRQANYRLALPLVRPLLRDERDALREMALTIVTEWGDAAALDSVRQMAFADPNPFRRPQAVLSLALLGGAGALPDLIKLTGDLNGHVRRAAAEALGRLPGLPPAAVSALQRLLDDPVAGESAAATLAAQDAPGFDAAPVRQPLELAPPSLQPRIPMLLEMLQEWQAALPGLTSPDQLPAVARLDQALTHLISVLREAAEG